MCVILLIFFLDRYTKLFILNNFTENTYYLNDYINLDLVWNTGIGFGLMSFDNQIFYNSISAIIGIVIILLLFIAVKSKRLEKFSFSIIIGGALGNFYDRISYNAVPDFIDIHYKNFHWFTFNFADIFITLGVLLLILSNIFKKNEN